jgi:hypothetical protein
MIPPLSHRLAAPGTRPAGAGLPLLPPGRGRGRTTHRTLAGSAPATGQVLQPVRLGAAGHPGHVTSQEPGLVSSATGRHGRGSQEQCRRYRGEQHARPGACELEDDYLPPGASLSDRGERGPLTQAGSPKFPCQPGTGTGQSFAPMTSPATRRCRDLPMLGTRFAGWAGEPGQIRDLLSRSRLAAPFWVPAATSACS